MIPGQILPADKEIDRNAGRARVRLAVTNTADCAIQVGSHYHFFEANPALEFDRHAAKGCRLDIAAGAALCFEPGQTRQVSLVPYAGAKKIFGFNAAIMGAL